MGQKTSSIHTHPKARYVPLQKGTRMDPEPEQGTTPKKSQKYPPGTWIGIGIAIGAAFGIALNDIAVGIGCGLAIGASLDAFSYTKKKGT